MQINLSLKVNKMDPNFISYRLRFQKFQLSDLLDFQVKLVLDQMGLTEVLLSLSLNLRVMVKVMVMVMVMALGLQELESGSA
mgnify:CR=1 FL=1